MTDDTGSDQPSESAAGPEQPSAWAAGPERPPEREAGPERPPEREPGPERPPERETPQPLAAGGASDYTGPAAPRRPRRMVVALVVGIVAILGGAAFAVTQLAGESSSPEEAVEKLFQAVADEDVLGVLEALPPSERDVIKGPVQDIVDELKRLDILAGNADLGNLAGVEFEVDDLELSSQTLREGLAEVRIDRGTVTSSADPARLPLGGFVRDLAGDDLREAQPTGPDADDLSSDDPEDFLVAVEEDGRWYVSFWYTVAELARRGSDAPMPDLGERVNADGADSAEGAVDAFLRASLRLDLRRMIELLPPDEARALHDYAPLFLDEAQDAGEDFRRSVDVDITQLDLRTTGQDDGRAVVQVEKLGFDGVVREENLRISYRDGCATLAPLTGRGETERFCPGDFGEGAPELFDRFLPPEVDAPELDVEQPTLGIATVRNDGKWYISPTRTVLDNIVATLRVLDRDDLEAIRELVEELD